MLDIDNVYYFASPYSHEYPNVVQARYKEQQRLVAHLIKEYGLLVINPIEMCHNLGLKYKLPQGYEYWMKRDRKLISISDAVIVALMPGWDISKGVTDEIAYAKSLGHRVFYIDPVSMLISEGA